MTRQPTPQEKDKWAAQRQEKLTSLQAQLADGLQQLMEASGWMTWLKVAHRFHTYSLNNQILIAIQNPAATQVAGYGGALAYSIVHYSLIFAGARAG